MAAVTKKAAANEDYILNFCLKERPLPNAIQAAIFAFVDFDSLRVAPCVCINWKDRFKRLVVLIARAQCESISRISLEAFRSGKELFGVNAVASTKIMKTKIFDDTIEILEVTNPFLPGPNKVIPNPQTIAQGRKLINAHIRNTRAALHNYLKQTGQLIIKSKFANNAESEPAKTAMIFHLIAWNKAVLQSSLHYQLLSSMIPKYIRSLHRDLNQISLEGLVLPAFNFNLLNSCLGQYVPAADDRPMSYNFQGMKVECVQNDKIVTRRLTTATATPLCQSLCNPLNLVNLSITDIDSLGFLAGKRVRRLDVSQTQVGDQAIQQLCQNGLEHLEVLDITGTAVTATGLRMIANAKNQHRERFLKVVVDHPKNEAEQAEVEKMRATQRVTLKFVKP